MSEQQFDRRKEDRRKGDRRKKYNAQEDCKDIHNQIEIMNKMIEKLSDELHNLTKKVQG